MKKPPTDYDTARSIRNAIANEVAKQIEITPELVEAKQEADYALDRYREAIKVAVRNLR
jgi:hypothetical protein